MLLQLLQRNADYYPHDSAIVGGDTCISHAELVSRVQRCARGLLDIGIQPGDRVALFLENSPDFVTAFFATVACRGVVVPLNVDCKQEELRFLLADAEVRALIVDAPRAELAQRTAAKTSPDIRLIVVGEHRADAVSFSTLLSSTGRTRLPSASLDDDVVYLYSSGSTGRPKCAPRTLEQYWWEMDDVVECLHLTRADRIFCAIPLYHNFGAVHCMLAAAGSGARLVMLGNVHPFVLRRRYALRLMQREQITVFPCVPFILGQLAEASTEADLTSIRVCYSGAAALTRDVADAFFEKFSVPIRQHYGCTEVGAMTINLDADPQAFGQSVGNAFPGVRIRILDDAGTELPVGSIGEVVVCSRQMTRGYRGEDEINQTLFRDGSFFTGDLGRLDGEGRLYLMGRKKFVIDVVGQKVSPLEVEDVLAEHPAVLESVVIGVPNPTGVAEVVQAYVVAGEHCTREELTEFCRERLANYKVPQKIEFISAMPKDTLGKVQRKRDVLAEYIVESAAAHGRRVSA